MHLDLPADHRIASPRRSSFWIDRGFALLWVAAVLVPLLGVGSAGIGTWRAVQEEAAHRMERTVELLRQHALRAFDAQEAILAAVARVTAGRGAEELRADATLHALLADLSASGAPLVRGVLVTDETWRIASASWEYPARPADLSDRDYVRMLQEGGVRRAVGEPVASRPMGWDVIPVARRVPAGERRDAPTAVVVSSFAPAALEAFYASVAETPDDVVAMVREDGTMLARHPPPDVARAREAREQFALVLADQMAAPQRPRWVVSPLDERRRLFLVRQAGEWPVFVVYALDRAGLVAIWRRRMVAPVLGGLAAMLLLLGLTASAQRSARLQREQAETRAEAETQLARAGRAAAIGLLVAGLAHDVKNLVQAVRSGTRVMQRRAEEPEEVRRCAALLGDAAERGGRLVDSMLAFARGGDAEGDEPAPQFAPGPAMAELAELLARTLGSRWSVQALVPPDLPATRGDRAGFEAAVVNLAANARDAMADGGTVVIAGWTEELEQPVEEAGLRPGRYVVTAVRDTGTGMDEATLARLGEPFFTTKPPGIGNGLGLATVRGFCARAGGALRFDSLPGRGTTAAIWLPVA